MYIIWLDSYSLYHTRISNFFCDICTYMYVIKRSIVAYCLKMVLDLRVLGKANGTVDKLLWSKKTGKPFFIPFCQPITKLHDAIHKLYRDNVTDRSQSAGITDIHNSF